VSASSITPVYAVLTFSFSCSAVAQPRSSNVRQLASIAGICNSATFDPTENDQPAEIRTVHGDATDSAILRFSELLSPVSRTTEPWEEVFKVNFNSKTKFSECQS
jgi:sodium/potassium-transporting ATPase subunit alpha